MWARVLSLLSLLTILCNSISIMFVTSDIETIMGHIASTYREGYVLNPKFEEGSVECINDICISRSSPNPKP